LSSVARRLSLPARLGVALQAPVDIAGLAYFRILFGTVLAWEGRRLAARARPSVLLDQNMLFTYWPFDFLGSLPEPAITSLPYVLMFSGLCVALGFYYRASAIAAFLSLTWLFLLEKSFFLNHIYLTCLITFLMIFLPAHREWSVDAHLEPKLKRAFTPAWNIWLLRFQVGLPYFFAGVAKMNEDWLRDSEPLRLWLSRNMDFPLIGRFFDQGLVFRSMALGSLALDLSVAFLLLNRRTRVFAYAAALTFHLMNSRLFDIGIFPWMMIVVTPVFFPPEWPRRLLEDLRTRSDPLRVLAFGTGAVTVGIVASLLPREYSPMHTLTGALGGGILGYFLWLNFRSDRSEAVTEAVDRSSSNEEMGGQGLRQVAPMRRVVMAALALWVGTHLLVPVRHLVIPGEVNWTEEGYRFSWQMMLADKRSDSVFFVKDPDTGEGWRVLPLEFLTRQQTAVMSGRPDMILQFAHYLRDRGHRVGRENVQVRVRAMVSMNGRAPALLVDPDTDLARVDRPWIGHADWVSLQAPPRR